MKNFQGSRGQGGGRGGDKRFAGGGSNFRGNDRGFDRPQLHRATCVDCGNSCEVPFKPNGSKPVYCRDCFKKDDGGAGSNRFERTDSRGFNREEKRLFHATCASCGDGCEVPFKPNGSKPVYCRGCFDKAGDAPVVTRYERNPAPTRNAGDAYAEQFLTLNAKLDRILKLMTPSVPEKVAIVELKKVKKADVIAEIVEVEKHAKATEKKADAKKKTGAKKKAVSKKK